MSLCKKLQYIKLLACGVVLVVLSSCYQYDPIEAKERLLAGLKENPNPNGGGEDPENPPIIPEPINPPDNPDAPDDKPNKGESLIKVHFNFDKWVKKPDMPYFLPLTSDREDPSNTYWVSASNRGYTMFSSKLEDYPVLELKEGYKNSGVKLISRPPGVSVSLVPKLLAGSLYAGRVVGNITNTNPAEFGRPWPYEPKQLKVYYKYKAGTKAINGLTGQDKGSINAVLYDVTYNKSYLDKESVKNDERIVLRAYKQVSDEANWKELTLDFKVINERLYKKLDVEKRKYRLALIFSSSAKGDVYIGALGSTLCVDELTVICKNPKQEEEQKEQPNSGNGTEPTTKEQTIETLVSFDSWKTVIGKRGSYGEIIPEENGLEWFSPSNEDYDKNGWSKIYNYSYPLTELKRAKSGSGCLLLTRGSQFKLPNYIISGLLCNGYSKPNRIGQNWDKGEPSQISFNYKYKAGAKTVYGGLKGKDKGLVRALFYEVTDDDGYYLNAAELKKTDNDRIVLECSQAFGDEEWGQEMTLEFEVKNEARYKALDFKQKKYRLALIFSSSYKYLEKQGVWDSMLQIDELKIISKKK